MKLRDNNSNNNNNNYYSRRWLVQYKNQQGKDWIIQHATRVHHWFNEEKLVSVDLDDDTLSLLLHNNPEIVSSIERDHLWMAQGYLERIIEPSELQRNRRLLNSEEEEVIPYGISMVQADQVTMGDTPITVCIVDTGINLQHPDLDATLVTGAHRETQDEDGEPFLLRWNKDQRGHGTHVAGTIMARANNAIGVRGMGEIPIFVTRGLDDSGNAYESDIRQAIEQCETSGAQIVSLSLGGDEMSNAMKTLCERLYHEKNMLIFAAAGNAGEWKLEYPASDPSVISVSAVDETEWYWDRANYGPTLELMAPGVGILSTTVNSTGAFYYAEYSGTSMAVPHASGAAALVWSHHPECTNRQIRFALAATAKDMGDPGCDTDFGYGIVQVKSALEFLNAHPCVDATWGEVVITGNCTVLDVPESRAGDDILEETESPVVDFPKERDVPDMDIPEETEAPTADLTEAPTEAPTNIPEETEAPTADFVEETESTEIPIETESPNFDIPEESDFPTEAPTGYIPEESHFPTEAPTKSPIEFPTMNIPEESEFPTVFIPEDESVLPTIIIVEPNPNPGPLPTVTIPLDGPLDFPDKPIHPFEPPGVTTVSNDDDILFDPRDDVVLSPTVWMTPMPSMAPTSRLDEDEGEDVSTDEVDKDVVVDDDDEEEEEQNESSTKPEPIFSFFVSPFDGTDPTQQPLLPVAVPNMNRNWFRDQANSNNNNNNSRRRRKKRPTTGIWS